MNKSVFFISAFLVLSAMTCSGFLSVKSRTPANVYFTPGPAADIRQNPLYRRALVAAKNPNALERIKIDYLIELIRHSPYTFIRNGAGHTGKQGAAHLLWKYRHALAKVTSAQIFIDEIATRSFSSGELYLVKSGETSYPLRDILINELTRLNLALKEDQTLKGVS